MGPNRRSVDYDSIASGYDRRYEENEYAGIQRALRQLITSPSGTRVLEVGCGTGHWLGVLAAYGLWAAGIDVSRAMLTRVRGHPVVQGRVEFLPWATASFDHVVCINALHHFADAPAFLAEAWRILRSSGSVMIIGQDPHTDLDHWCVYDYFAGTRERDRRRYPASATIRAWMAAAGFADCDSFEAQHLDFQVPAREALAHGRLDRSVTSQLSLLTDAEYEDGLERIRRDIAREEARGRSLPLIVDLHLYATVGMRR